MGSNIWKKQPQLIRMGTTSEPMYNHSSSIAINFNQSSFDRSVVVTVVVFVLTW